MFFKSKPSYHRLTLISAGWRRKHNLRLSHLELLQLARPPLQPDPHQAGDPDTTGHNQITNHFANSQSDLTHGLTNVFCLQVSSLTSSPDSSPSPGMMGAVSVQAHLASSVQQSSQLLGSGTPQQQQDPTKSIQWQITTSQAGQPPASTVTKVN